MKSRRAVSSQERIGNDRAEGLTALGYRRGFRSGRAVESRHMAVWMVPPWRMTSCRPPNEPSPTAVATSPEARCLPCSLAATVEVLSTLKVPSTLKEGAELNGTLRLKQIRFGQGRVCCPQELDT
ncbi:hypothetical protein COCON_G00112980 [Conger conger]|uniref:Uncharacterized protein n=1 Tax=Conger conger TaxID=82655 RepID=A0A9Q1DK10_CONCO|nr:hypothetical protein COCON_G00112980 [Conger conger]